MIEKNKVSLVVADIGVTANSLKACKKTMKEVLKDPLVREYLQLNQIKKLSEPGYVG